MGRTWLDRIGLAIHQHRHSITYRKLPACAPLEPGGKRAGRRERLLSSRRKPSQCRRSRVAEKDAHIRHSHFIYWRRIKDACLAVKGSVGQYIVTWLPLGHGIGKAAAKADLCPLTTPHEAVIARVQRHVDAAFFMCALLVATRLKHLLPVEPHLYRAVARHHEARALSLRTVEIRDCIGDLAILPTGKTPGKIQ